MRILCNDQRVELPAESTVLDCLRAAGAEGAVLAAMRGGQVLALNEPLRDSCTLTPITMDDEAGPTHLRAFPAHDHAAGDASAVPRRAGAH